MLETLKSKETVSKLHTIQNNLKEIDAVNIINLESTNKLTVSINLYTNV